VLLTCFKKGTGKYGRKVKYLYFYGIMVACECFGRTYCLKMEAGSSSKTLVTIYSIKLHTRWLQSCAVCVTHDMTWHDLFQQMPPSNYWYFLGEEGTYVTLLPSLLCTKVKYFIVKNVLKIKCGVWQHLCGLCERWHVCLQDVAITLFPLTEAQQTYTAYLGNSLSTILGVRQCPVNKMTLCVTSDAELEKCVKMRVCTCLILYTLRYMRTGVCVCFMLDFKVW